MPDSTPRRCTPHALRPGVSLTRPCTSKPLSVFWPTCWGGDHVAVHGPYGGWSSRAEAVCSDPAKNPRQNTVFFPLPLFFRRHFLPPSPICFPCLPVLVLSTHCRLLCHRIALTGEAYTRATQHGTNKERSTRTSATPAQPPAAPPAPPLYTAYPLPPWGHSQRESGLCLHILWGQA